MDRIDLAHQPVKVFNMQVYIVMPKMGVQCVMLTHSLGHRGLSDTDSSWDSGWVGPTLRNAVTVHTSLITGYRSVVLTTVAWG